MRKPDTIWVRNNGEDMLESRYDGEEVIIVPGESVEMLVDAAALILGFGEDDKARAVRRLGWAPSSNDLPAAKKRLEAFSFHMSQAEAQAYVPSSASAPGSDETAGVGKPAPAGVGIKGAGLSPLKKLAQAQAAAG